MKMKAVIVVIVVLLLVGIFVYALIQSTPSRPSSLQQERESAESQEALMQDHLDDALADMGYVDERFLQG